MSRLVLINGAPGVGKSTTADALAHGFPRMVAVNIDAIKHGLESWSADPEASGIEARRLAIAEIDRYLSGGLDVVLGQYLARVEFIEELEALATRLGAKFVEVILCLDATSLAVRLAGRSESPDRPEHDVNGLLVGPDDADALVASIQHLRVDRPDAKWVRADSLGSTLNEVRELLG